MILKEFKRTDKVLSIMRFMESLEKGSIIRSVNVTKNYLVFGIEVKEDE